MPKLSKSDQKAKVSTNEARRRKEVALAHLRELELYERAGKLVPEAKVSNAWSKILSQVRDAVLRIPDKCAPAVVAAGGVQEARSILASECEAILRGLSDEIDGAARPN